MTSQRDSDYSDQGTVTDESIRPDLVQISVTAEIDLDKLETEWPRLETLANAPYFLSWGWVGTWLSTLPASIKPLLLTAQHNDETVGLALLIRNTRLGKLLLFQSNVMLMNETGDPYYDLLTIEYNNLLVHRDYCLQVTHAFINYMVNHITDWDEIVINAADANSYLTQPDFIEANQLHQKVIKELPSWYIDLNMIRNSGKSYLDHLSSNTRHQIRRAVRECEKTGPLQISIAESVEEANQFLDRLAELHQVYWNNKGQVGCFSNPYFLKFHKTLIERRFPHKEIQLAKIRLGERDLGYLYSLISDKQLFFYQSGLNYALGEKLKPGLVAHYLMIEHNLSQGMSLYNFLAGSERYKRSLSTDHDRLLWLSLQKNRLNLRIENGFNNVYASSKQLAKKVIYRNKRH